MREEEESYMMEIDTVLRGKITVRYYALSMERVYCVCSDLFCNKNEYWVTIESKVFLEK